MVPEARSSLFGHHCSFAILVGMLLNDQTCEEFREVYKKDTGEDITIEEAREIASRLLELYRLLARPLPSEIEARAKQLSEKSPSPPEM